MSDYLMLLGQISAAKRAEAAARAAADVEAKAAVAVEGAKALDLVALRKAARARVGGNAGLNAYLLAWNPAVAEAVLDRLEKAEARLAMLEPKP